MLKRSLALGVLMAFVITGSAWAAEPSQKVDNAEKKFTNVNIVTAVNDSYGVYATNGAKATLEGDSTIKVTHKGEKRPVYGIYAYRNNPVINVNGNSLQVNVVNEYNGPNENDGGWARGISANSGAIINLNVKEVGVCVCASVDDLKTSGNNNGLSALLNGSRINVNSQKLNIDVFGVSASGIYAGNNTIPADDTNLEDNARIVIGENTVTNINVYNNEAEKKFAGNGITALSMGRIDIKGDLYVNAKNAVATRGDAIVNINTDGGNKVVQLTGDINFNYNRETSGTPVNANVNINLTNDKSFFNGKICVTGVNIPKGYDEVNSMNIKVTNGAQWNLTGASIVNNAEFGKDSVLNLENGELYNSANKDAVYALNASGFGENNSLNVDKDAKLQIGGIKETTYNIATGFENYDAVEGWTEIADNALMQANKVLNEKDKTLQIEITAKKAEQIAEDLSVSETTGDFLNNIVVDANESGITENDGTAEGKLVGLANAAAKSNNDVVKAKAAAQAVEAVQKMAEAGGNSATAANVVTNVTNVTGQRLSFSGGNAGGNKGGHGVGLLEEGSGAAIWAQYVHGKDSVEDMPSEAGASSYEGQYNGIVMGVDFKKVGKFQSGIAFNYGEGDTNSVNTTSPTRSEYDFWGIGYYGNIRNADSNVIFDIGYAKTDSDVTSNVIAEGYAETFEASPETTTWTAGVKVEKLYQNNNVQIVPYTGLRYMSIDPEDYTTKCGAMGYKMERQDIWLLPVGVSIKQEIVNPNGWVVTPKVDLSYIWAFGDTDSSMETNTVFGSDNRPIGYDVMDDGSWMGLVGVEAAMDDWTFGVSYSYQKGDHSESKKWYVDAKYSF